MRMQKVAKADSTKRKHDWRRHGFNEKLMQMESGTNLCISLNVATTMVTHMHRQLLPEAHGTSNSSSDAEEDYTGAAEDLSRRHI